MQPTLFDSPGSSVSIDDVILYALGEFQARGHKLADRELALDRLHRAFVRAAARFGVSELTDEQIVDGLHKLGTTVLEIPRFFAKRPYRVTVPEKVCRTALDLFEAD